MAMSSMRIEARTYSYKFGLKTFRFGDFSLGSLPFKSLGVKTLRVLKSLALEVDN